jgi:hypothetical protein
MSGHDPSLSMLSLMNLTARDNNTEVDNRTIPEQPGNEEVGVAF